MVDLLLWMGIAVILLVVAFNAPVLLSATVFGSGESARDVSPTVTQTAPTPVTSPTLTERPAPKGVSTLQHTIKTETVTPANSILRPGQQVTAHIVISYDMLTSAQTDETFQFSTELQNPAWDFAVYHDGNPISNIQMTGCYASLTEFELSYPMYTELDVQVRGTVPSTGSLTVLVTKLDHLRGTSVKGTYSLTRDVGGTG